MNHGSSIEKFADAIACIVKAPRTVRELHKLTGVRLDSLHAYMRALEGEGLIEKFSNEDRKGCGRRGPASTLYRWKTPDVSAAVSALKPGQYLSEAA